MVSLARDTLYRGIYNPDTNDAEPGYTDTIKSMISYSTNWDKKSFANKVNDPDIFGQNKRLESENAIE